MLKKKKRDKQHQPPNPPKIPGKTYSLTQDEKKLLEQYHGIMNIQSGIVISVRNQVRQIEMQCKDRVGIEPTQHAQFNLKEGTFFVPDLPKPTQDVPSEESQPKTEEGKTEK